MFIARYDPPKRFQKFSKGFEISTYFWTNLLIGEEMHLNLTLPLLSIQERERMPIISR